MKLSSGVPKTGWFMKLRKQTKKKTDFSESSKKREPNTHKRRFYKKCLQEIIRLAYERVHTSKDLPSMGQKIAAGFVSSSSRQSAMQTPIPNLQNANASQHIQTQKWSFKRRRELFHTDITQHFPTGFSMAVRGRREGFGASHTDNIRQERRNRKQQRLFSKVLRLKTRIPSRQSTRPMMYPSWAQKEGDETTHPFKACVLQCPSHVKTEINWVAEERKGLCGWSILGHGSWKNLCTMDRRMRGGFSHHRLRQTRHRRRHPPPCKRRGSRRESRCSGSH